ncbi:MAG: hypothetical protein DA446_02845 [Bacteroidetes bacterium]|jgi:hypothetical protein|nr:MAG: hypothetical protein DA446_02845 [Bacteroidota bacterium]
MRNAGIWFRKARSRVFFLAGFLSVLMAVLLPLTTDLLLAQKGGYAGAFSRMGYGPRGIAMGNAMSAFAGDGSYAYYNPALAALNQDHIQVDMAAARLSFDRSLHMTGVQLQLPPSAGISFSLIHAGVQNIDSRTSSGYHIGQISTDEFQLQSAFGLRVREQTWLGIGIKYLISRFHNDMENSTSIGFDIGLRHQFTTSTALSVSVHDLFAAYRFDASGLYGIDQSIRNEQAFPVRTKVGFAYTPESIWFLMGELEIQRSDAEQQTVQTGESQGNPVVRTVRSETRSYRHLVKAGGGAHVHERLTLRAGMQWVEPNGESYLRPGAGFSLHLPWDRFSPSIDYAAFKERAGVPLAHLFSFRFHL